MDEIAREIVTLGKELIAAKKRMDAKTTRIAALEKQVESLQPYQMFAVGLPIGSGVVEFGGNILGRLCALKAEADKARQADTNRYWHELYAELEIESEKNTQFIRAQRQRINGMEEKIDQDKAEIEEERGQIARRLEDRERKIVQLEEQIQAAKAFIAEQPAAKSSDKNVRDGHWHHVLLNKVKALETLMQKSFASSNTRIAELEDELTEHEAQQSKADDIKHEFAKLEARLSLRDDRTEVTEKLEERYRSLLERLMPDDFDGPAVNCYFCQANAGHFNHEPNCDGQKLLNQLNDEKMFKPADGGK